MLVKEALGRQDPLIAAYLVTCTTRTYYLGKAAECDVCNTSFHLWLVANWSYLIEVNVDHPLHMKHIEGILWVNGNKQKVKRACQEFFIFYIHIFDKDILRAVHWKIVMPATITLMNYQFSWNNTHEILQAINDEIWHVECRLRRLAFLRTGLQWGFRSFTIQNKSKRNQKRHWA